MSCCVALGKLLNFFEPQFSPLINVLLPLLKDYRKDELELNEMMYVIAHVSSTELPKSGRDGCQC